MSMNTIASSSAAEFLVGSVCGTALDSLFGAKQVTDDNGFMLLVETGIQVMISTFVAGACLNMLKQRGYYEPSANNWAFLVSYIASQPGLIAKITGTTWFVKGKMMNPNLGAYLPSKGPQPAPAPSEKNTFMTVHGNPSPYADIPRSSLLM
jgi:hypothetical protein